ncbi:hypothetical protein TNCV_1137531 [Trichonephila clavipes]|nr:hypothetical protein TNCV_1137531 [Trichonephila clavipes]
MTAAHGSFIVTIEFSQSAVSFLEEPSPIPTLKTTSGRCKNVARKLTSAEGLGFYEEESWQWRWGKKVYGQKAEEQQMPANRMHPAFVLFEVLIITMKIKDRDDCKVVALVHLGSMRNMSN